jgi:hypothetical protein
MCEQWKRKTQTKKQTNIDKDVYEQLFRGHVAMLFHIQKLHRI